MIVNPSGASAAKARPTENGARPHPASTPVRTGVIPARLHVLVADADPTIQQFYRTALPEQGHQVCVAGTGSHLVEQYRLLQPDLVITAAQLPGLDGLSAAAEMCRDRPVPIIVVTASQDAELIERIAANVCVVGCLVKPIREADLRAAIALAMCGFERIETLRREAADLRRTLEDRKLIERAKGIVMRRLAVDEKDAFDRVRKLASDRNRKLVEIAQMVLTAEATFEALEPHGSGPTRDGTTNGRHRPLRHISHALVVAAHGAPDESTERLHQDGAKP